MLVVEENIITIIMGTFTLISTIWAIRSQLKQFQGENEAEIERRTKMESQVQNLTYKLDDLHLRVGSLEADKHEVKALIEKVDSIYRELDNKIDNLIQMLIKRL